MSLELDSPLTAPCSRTLQALYARAWRSAGELGDSAPDRQRAPAARNGGALRPRATAARYGRALRQGCDRVGKGARSGGVNGGPAERVHSFAW